MNERIKELVEQCHHRYSDHQIDIEKFAELIVHECVKLHHRNIVVGGISEYNRGRRELTEDILKHFGVKE